MASVTTISGAVSGLDTASIINSLVSVQQNQQTLLKQQQAVVQRRSAAYASLSTSLSTLSTQAADLADTSAWAGATATSSSANVTASATATSAASLTFDVSTIASRHTLISSNTLSATTAQAASGPLTLTRSDATTASIDVGSGSLADVVAGINKSGTGLAAAAVQTGLGAYRLQVASTSTGSASSFRLEGLDGFSSIAVLTAGADATLHLGGTSDAAYDVTSASNTFASLVPGLSFTVSKPETGVTVASTVSGGAIADKVNTLITTANSILTSITANTAYNATNKTSGPFTGESSTRALAQNILSMVSGAGAPGVSLTRDGQLSFDRQKFLDAFTADPAKVAKSFGANSTFTPTDGLTGPSVTVTSGLTSARAGNYAIHVDTAPQQETWQIDPAGGDLAGQAIELTRGSSTVSYTVGSGQTLGQTAAAFNSVAAAAKFGVTATVVDGTLEFTADSNGAAQAFTAAADGVSGTQLTAGTDIAGTIDGHAATGVGSLLSLPNAASGAAGLTLDVSVSTADVDASGGAIGTLNYLPGLAKRLVTLVNDATNTQSGSLTTAKTGAGAQIKRYQADIDAWDTRLADYRASLTTQFTAMETALAALKTQTAAISNFVSSSSSSSNSSG
jgi:flagellar hook-associated protein 2